MARNGGTVTFDSDLTGDRRQTNGLAELAVASTVWSTERYVGVCGQDDRICPAACRAVRERGGIVVGIDDSFDQRTLTIACDVGIARRNCDGGCRGDSVS